MDSVDEIMLNLAKKFAVRKNRHRHLARGKSAIWSAVIFCPSSYIGVRVEISRKKRNEKVQKEYISLPDAICSFHSLMYMICHQINYLPSTLSLKSSNKEQIVARCFL